MGGSSTESTNLLDSRELLCPFEHVRCRRALTFWGPAPSRSHCPCLWAFPQPNHRLRLSFSRHACACRFSFEPNSPLLIHDVVHFSPISCELRTTLPAVPGKDQIIYRSGSLRSRQCLPSPTGESSRGTRTTSSNNDTCHSSRKVFLFPSLETY